MRVLLLTNQFPPKIEGGAEIFASDIAHALRQAGHEVRVLTERCDGHGGDEPWIQRTLREVVERPNGRNGSHRNHVASLVAFYRQTHCRANGIRVRQAVADWSPDVLFVWGIAGIGLISILNALRRVRTPIVFHLHDYWWQYMNSPQTRFSRVRVAWLKKVVIGPVPPIRFTTSIAVSDAVKRAYVRAGCQADRIEIIGTAIDRRFFQPKSTSVAVAPRPVLMYAGRLRSEKGVMVALEAVDRIVKSERREVSLRIYGSGDPRHEEELRAYVRRRGLEAVVSFHGIVNQDQLIHAYDQAQVVVIPSLWEEPSPLVALEAMARGVAVIVSDVGGMRALIDEVGGGLVVRAGHAASLAAAILHLLDHPAERRRMGETGRQAVFQGYTLDVRTREIERHLQAALGLDLLEHRWAG